MTTKKTIKDNTAYFIDCMNLLKEAKCRVMLIVNENAITNYLYKDFIKGRYNKVYQLTKRLTSHLICTNYPVEFDK